ncbi:hypothetical protein TGAMA5MH_05415 [Trichoderma gamsii]|uniref:Uncharacterized protein n=1 Tax=Trichoderma gamsii TaxID=398673 RepID=A0A2K0TAW7_9HYPO|nr:hypothetical protein TGAMA5MH_05415 [Trichoderma gamsii]
MLTEATAQGWSVIVSYLENSGCQCYLDALGHRSLTGLPEPGMLTL